MGLLDVYSNPNPGSRSAIPFLLDVQAELLASLGTRMVVPLYLEERAPAKAIRHLTPRLEFQGQAYVAMVPELAGVARRALGPLAGSLASQRKELLEALDFLFTGS